MNILHLQGKFISIRHLLAKKGESEEDAKMMADIAVDLLEDFLLEHKKQTEYLAIIANTLHDDQVARLKKGS